MSEVPVREDLGVAFVAALAAKDRDALISLLDPHVEFRGLTPGSSWEASTPDEVSDILIGSWFESEDHIRETLEVDTERVVDRDRVHYRLRVESEDVMYLVEQHGYFDAADGRITRMSLMCAGFRPWP
jgi:hypothetical protein